MILVLYWHIFTFKFSVLKAAIAAVKVAISTILATILILKEKRYSLVYEFLYRFKSKAVILKLTACLNIS